MDQFLDVSSSHSGVAESVPGPFLLIWSPLAREGLSDWIVSAWKGTDYYSD